VDLSFAAAERISTVAQARAALAGRSRVHARHDARLVESDAVVRNADLQRLPLI